MNVGGNWNNTTNAGLWYWNGNNSASNANSNVGGRICCMVSLLRDCISPTTRSKIADKECGLVGRKH
nr:MAG TPA: hypothetical protein [Caudoviricetes sp.]